MWDGLVYKKGAEKKVEVEEEKTTELGFGLAKLAAAQSKMEIETSGDTVNAVQGAPVVPVIPAVPGV